MTKLYIISDWEKEMIGIFTSEAGAKDALEKEMTELGYDFEELHEEKEDKGILFKASDGIVAARIEEVELQGGIYSTYELNQHSFLIDNALFNERS